MEYSGTGQEDVLLSDTAVGPLVQMQKVMDYRILFVLNKNWAMVASTWWGQKWGKEGKGRSMNNVRR